MKFWNSSDGTGSRIENKLKTVNLSRLKIKQKRVAIVDFGANKRSIKVTSQGCCIRTLKGLVYTSFESCTINKTQTEHKMFWAAVNETVLYRM